LSKVIRIFGIIIGVLVAGIIALVLIFDPPPLRLRDETSFVLSVPIPTAPMSPSVHDPLEMGLACNRKLEGATGSLSGRPVITIFDWLRQQSGTASERDYHLYGTKTNDSWAFKIDRPTNTVCYQTPRGVEAGLTDAYCGPKITDENANRIIAVENKPYDFVTAILFNKKTLALTMTQINVQEQLGASIEYFQCH
jgi:hypothetical protein